MDRLQVFQHLDFEKRITNSVWRFYCNFRQHVEQFVDVDDRQDFDEVLEVKTPATKISRKLRRFYDEIQLCTH